jgi:RHS repeat-associated protein
VVAGHRYEYDGLNLLRVDELYDSDSDGLDGDDLAADAWRALWVGTYRPGSLGALLHKSVYVYSDLEDNTPDSANEFTYTHDPVGNVGCVYDQSGNLAYEFTQDAFGNELPVGTLGGNDWHDAAGDGIVEHQTGKRMDEFTGLYYFHARYYDAEVGRFLGREPISLSSGPIHQYSFVYENPNQFADPNGKWGFKVKGSGSTSSERCCENDIIILRDSTKKSCDKYAHVDNTRIYTVDEIMVINCIHRQCLSGTIYCRRDGEGASNYCGPAVIGGVPGVIVGYTLYSNPSESCDFSYGTPRPCTDNTPAVCIQHAHPAGDTAIHEWGHVCGCNHSEGGQCPNKLEDYAAGRPCQSLPK